ncbi:MAG: hypothetical protein IJE41_02490, partial [Clostridia bacterium]|nr:hypothetical protein [Clostridia bacterium]
PTVKENHAQKTLRPCEGRLKEFGGNRNSPTLFAILALKMARGLPLGKRFQYTIGFIKGFSSFSKNAPYN